MFPILASAGPTQQVFAAIILVVVFVAFIRERIAPEVTALGGMALMVFTGVLPVADAMRAFSNEAVLMVACMLVVCLSLERAGVVAKAGAVYEKAAGASARRGLWVLMSVCGLLSAFLNNTSIVIIFLPLVMAVSKRQGVAPSRVLIPLSFATVAGGMVTLIGTSTNMVVVGKAREYGISFNMFEIAGLGLAVFAVTLTYLGFFAPRLLKDRVALSAILEDAQSREYLTRAFVAAGSALDGREFTKTNLAKVRGIRLIEVIRDGIIVDTAFSELVLQAGDQLILKGRIEDVMTMRQTAGLEMVPSSELGLEGVKTEKAVLMEAVLGPGSSLLHKSIKQLNFRQRYGVLILAVHRMGVNLRERFEDMRFLMGDTLLLEGPPEQMNQLFKERGFINLTKPRDTRPRKEKAKLAFAILIAVCILGSLAETQTERGPASAPVAAAVVAPAEAGAGGVAPALRADPASAVQTKTKIRNGETILTSLGMPDLSFGFIALGGALLCIFFRCVDTAEIYDAMEWRILLLIIGTVGIGAGMEKSGLASTLADGLVGSLQGFGSWTVLAGLYLIAVILTEFLSNTAVAAIITPIAMQTAHTLHVDPKPFLVAAMFGSTLAFSTPIGYQTNLLVYNAGGYKFSDFCRIGIPLTILLWILCSLLIPVFWPLTPL